VREIHVSEITDFKTCPRLYRYRHVEGLVPILRDPKLTLGTGMHVGLAAYYTGRDAIAYYDAWAEMTLAEMGENATDETVEQVALGVKLLKAYIEYAAENDDFKPITIEQTYSVPVWIPGGRVARVRHCGAFDGLVKDAYGKLWLMEHKTTAQFANETYLRLDEQVGYYLLAAVQLYNEIPAGVMYNQIRKVNPAKARTPIIQRTHVVRCPTELKALRDRLYYTYRQIGQDKLFLPHPALHCTWRCGYVQLCIAEDDGTDATLLKRLAYVQGKRQSYGNRLVAVGKYIEERRETDVGNSVRPTAGACSQ
jgi:hypothetical protein